MTDAVPAPQACESMAQVRAGVDALDRELVALLARRQGYMDAAARIKSDRAHVRDDVRVEEVITRVKVSARAAGLAAVWDPGNAAHRVGRHPVPWRGR